MAILNYRVSGPILSLWVALFLPWIELIAGFGLIIYPLRRASGPHNRNFIAPFYRHAFASLDAWLRDRLRLFWERNRPYVFRYELPLAHYPQYNATYRVQSTFT